MSYGIVHRAAEPDGLVQKCADCGVVLCNYVNALGIGTWSPHWWGGLVTVYEGFPVQTIAGAKPDAMPCTRKEQ